MATKRQVVDAYYEGICTALMSSEVYRHINPIQLEVDHAEFQAWLVVHDEWEDLRDWFGQSR